MHRHTHAHMVIYRLYSQNRTCTTICVLAYLYAYVLISNFMFIGLTDKVLESVVAKGNRELLSLDLSAVPHLLTDHALSVIGQYVDVIANECTHIEKQCCRYCYMFFIK